MNQKGGEVKFATVCLVSVLALAVPVSLEKALGSGQSSSGSSVQSAESMDLGWG
jgi:hypothetical protein